MGMSDIQPTPKPRCFRPRPGSLILALLVVEALLWLSERFQWFGFNQHKGWTVLRAGESITAARCLRPLPPCLAGERVFLAKERTFPRSLDPCQLA
jgi:hypothetical protein